MKQKHQPLPKSLELLLEQKIDKLNKRNDSHLTPRKQKNLDHYELSKSKWENLKDSVNKVRSERKPKIRVLDSVANDTSSINTIDGDSKYRLPLLWTIRDYQRIAVFINKRQIIWNPPIVLLKVQDIQPLYDFGYFESAHLLLNVIGNSNISPYFKQKQNTTARFFRQWANLELAYFRFDEAIQVLEMGIEIDAQPVHHLVENRDKIRNKLIANKKDEKISMTPLKTPSKPSPFDQDDFDESFSELQLTPSKSFIKDK